MYICVSKLTGVNLAPRVPLEEGDLGGGKSEQTDFRNRSPKAKDRGRRKLQWQLGLISATWTTWLKDGGRRVECG